MVTEIAQIETKPGTENGYEALSPRRQPYPP
jgi:hypothetical protein